MEMSAHVAVRPESVVAFAHGRATSRLVVASPRLRPTGTIALPVTQTVAPRRPRAGARTARCRTSAPTG